MVASPCRLEYFPSSAASRSVRPVAPLQRKIFARRPKNIYVHLSIIFSLLILIKCCRISVITRLCSVLSPAAAAALLLRGAGSRMLPLTEARYLHIDIDGCKRVDYLPLDRVQGVQIMVGRSGLMSCEAPALPAPLPAGGRAQAVPLPVVPQHAVSLLSLNQKILYV